MPRNVRPAWIDLEVDGRMHRIGTGPQAKGGWIRGLLRLRTPSGSVSEAIGIIAGGPNPTCRITIPSDWDLDIDYVGRQPVITARPIK